MTFEQTMLELLEARRGGGANVSIAIEGKEITATTQEGKSAKMPLDQFLAKVMPNGLGTGSVILPDGVKAMFTENNASIWFWECPPQLYNVLWIAKDSPAPYGPGAKYRKVRLALPFLIIVAVFVPSGCGTDLQLSASNECFFRNAPLKSLDDELLYPALLNCSKFSPPEGRPLAWICTQHLRPNAMMQSPNYNERLRGSFEALRHCMLETAFNYSSEHHEGASWYSESRKVDPRLETVEAWQEASAQNPMFVLDVPWLKTGHTLGQLRDRIFRNLHGNKTRQTTAASLARIIFNHTPK